MLAQAHSNCASPVVPGTTATHLGSGNNVDSFCPSMLCWEYSTIESARYSDVSQLNSSRSMELKELKELKEGKEHDTLLKHPRQTAVNVLKTKQDAQQG